MEKFGKIAKQSEDFPAWYQDVVREGDLAEVAKVVRGCMVIKPHGYAIWEKIQADLDARFKATGHKNAYFPLLIPMSFMNKEAEHVEGFAPEIAVVTHAGGKELPEGERYCIRPTSETIIGHFFSKWISSYRDLPLLINQWANVMRWEMHTRMFLRTTEFLWQEGHTAHSSHQEATEEVARMLNVYGDFAEEVMAMPVIRGIKTEAEKFAGALETRCIEAMMRDGKALQAGTSHDLGQNFGKAFDVVFQSEKGHNEYVWQTSWGVSTRLVGGLIMTHSDDSGLILPPALAPVEVVIVPIFRKEAEKALVMPIVDKIAAQLKEKKVAVEVDDREEKRPGDKYYEWERKGVPIRIEIGKRDVESQTAMVKMRLSTEKDKMPLDLLSTQIPSMLEQFQKFLYKRALDFREQNTVVLDDWNKLKEVFNDGASKFAWCHWDGTRETETQIKEETKVSIRCIPLPGQGFDDGPGRCIKTGNPSKKRVLMAKAY